MDVSFFKSIFPRSLELLLERNFEQTLDQFAMTLKQEIGLDPFKSPRQDVARFFPVFLKLRKIPQNLLEVAEYEFLKFAVQTQDQGILHFQNMSLRLNPSVQFVELHFDQPRLSRTAGLYCFYKNHSEVQELKLTVQQALVVDLLQSDLADLNLELTIENLTELAVDHEFGKSYSRAEWGNMIQGLITCGLLMKPTPSKVHPEFADASRGALQ